MASMTVLRDISSFKISQKDSNISKEQSVISPSRPFFTSNLVALLISGHVSAFCGGMIAFPFEKVLLRHSAGLDPYGNMREGLKYIYQNEGGLSAFYRGITFRFARISIATVPLIVSDEVLRRVFVSPDKSLDIKGEALCALLSGVCATAIHHPFDRARLGIQTSLHDKPTSTTNVWRLYQYNGFLNLYRGSGRSILGNMSYAMVLFPTFAGLKHYNVLNKTQDLKSDLTYSGIACVLAMIGRRIVYNMTDVYRHIQHVSVRNVLNSNELKKQSIQKLVNLQRILPSTMLQLPLISISLSVIEFQKRYDNDINIHD